MIFFFLITCILVHFYHANAQITLSRVIRDRFVLSSAAKSAPYTIPGGPVDPSRTFVIHSLMYDEPNANSGMVLVYLHYLGNVVRFEREATGGEVAISFYILEFSQGVRVHHGVSNSGETAVYDATSFLADTNMIEVLYTSSMKSANTLGWPGDQSLFRLDKANTQLYLAFPSMTVPEGVTVGWQLIEIDGLQYSTSASNLFSGSLIDTAVAIWNPSLQSDVLFFSHYAQSACLTVSELLMTVNDDVNPDINFERGRSGCALWYEYGLARFSSEVKVQTGTFAMVAGMNTATYTLPSAVSSVELSVMMTPSMHHFGCKCSSATETTTGVCAFELELISTTQFRVTRASTSKPAFAERYFVLTFPGTQQTQRAPLPLYVPGSPPTPTTPVPPTAFPTPATTTVGATMAVTTTTTTTSSSKALGTTAFNNQGSSSSAASTSSASASVTSAAVSSAPLSSNQPGDSSSVATTQVSGGVSASAPGTQKSNAGEPGMVTNNVIGAPSDDELDGGQIAAIIIGIFVLCCLLLIIVFVLVYTWRRRQRAGVAERSMMTAMRRGGNSRRSSGRHGSSRANSGFHSRHASAIHRPVGGGSSSAGTLETTEYARLYLPRPDLRSYAQAPYASIPSTEVASTPGNSHRNYATPPSSHGGGYAHIHLNSQYAYGEMPSFPISEESSGSYGQLSLNEPHYDHLQFQ